MDDVIVGIKVSPEVAALLGDPLRAEAVGRLVSDMLRPGNAGKDPLAILIADIKADARAGGLTDIEVDAELAAYNAERRL